MAVDLLTPQQRSEQMSRVKPTGNKSTEGRAEAALLAAGIEGWIKHAQLNKSRPDFYFPQYQFAIFIDGCFWHACPNCARNWPTNRASFWREKIEGNRRRDNRKRRQLRREGYHVMRVWEHELKTQRWLSRLQALIRRIEREQLSVG